MRRVCDRSAPKPRDSSAYTSAVHSRRSPSRTRSPPSSRGSATACSTSLRDRLDCTIRLRGNQLTLEGDDAAASPRRARCSTSSSSSSRAGTRSGRDRRRGARRARPGRATCATSSTTSSGATAARRSRRRRSRRSATSTRSAAARSRSGSARPAPARRTSRWRSPSRRSPERQVGRIILTRPAVEAGERLGFLPGDMLAKVDPYLRPLFDALYDMLDAERLERVHGARHDRGRAARVHARPDAERLLHHPRRGAEHEPGADADVPDAARLRLEGRRHRRRDADRPPARPGVRADPGAADPRRRRRDRASSSSRTRTSSGTSSCSGSSRRTSATRRRRARSAAADGSRSRSTTGAGSRSTRRPRSRSPGDVLAAEGVEDGELGLAFVGPDEIRALKREHLGIDEATDVLSFPIDGRDELPDGVPRQLGDAVALPAGRRRGVAPAARARRSCTCSATSTATRWRRASELLRAMNAPAAGAPSLLESFNYAFEGIIHVLRTQRNMRIHFVAAPRRADRRRS